MRFFHHIRCYFIVTFWLSAALAQSRLAGQTDERVNLINAYMFCRKLASPEFQGRLTGHPGYTAAAKWVAGQFEAWGLRPWSPSGYLQPFPTEYTLVEDAQMTIITRTGDAAANQIKLNPGSDFLPLLFSDGGDKTGAAVFVGWGISAPELGYDDYAGVDVHGKFALCYRGTPNQGDARFTEHDEHRTRMRTACEKGALGIIYIYDEPIANPNGDWRAGFMPAVISQKSADLIFKEKDLRSAALRSDLAKYGRPLSFETGATVHYVVRSKHVPDGTGYNIAGAIEGSDPVLKHEYIIVGAHADHCGTLMGLQFSGADDNASGAATVMEIAEVLASENPKPRRSVVIALFGGEESGLKGSRYFADHLPESQGKPVAMLNFDMTGEGDQAHADYSQSSPELKKILDDSNAVVRVLGNPHPITGIGVQSSDFAPFFQRGIPCVSISSNGPHLSYHQSGDTIYRINPDILRDIARLGIQVVLRLSEQ